MSREQDSVAAEVERIARAMYYFGDWDTYAVEAQKNYWRGKARLALAALSHPQAASSTQAADRRLALELAAQFDWWLRFNADCHAKDGTQVHDDMHVIAPEWPRRETLKVWIDALTRLASSTTPASGGAGMLPDTLMAVSDEWYTLCERAPHAFKIGISGELAQAIVATVCRAAAQEGAQGDRGAA